MTPPAPRKESKLFLSCDLVGSTSYKQRQAARARSLGSVSDTGDDQTPWQQTFLEFYHDFPWEVASAKQEWMDGRDEAYAPTFDLWKPIGDELVFTVIVDHNMTVYNAVRVWLAAMRGWDKRMARYGMGTKGGAFIATFPGPDRAVAIPRSPDKLRSSKMAVSTNDEACAGEIDHAAYVYDYFGPSIDTGFRLFNSATPRRFPMSVEVTAAMLHTAYQARENSAIAHVKDLEYHGGREFKGVWNQRDYPFFTIDRRDADPVNAAVKELRDDLRIKNIAKATQLCSACLKDPDWPSAIYLPASGDDDLKQDPSDPLQAYVEQNLMIGHESDPIGDESEDLVGDDNVELPEDAPLGKVEDRLLILTEVMDELGLSTVRELNLLKEKWGFPEPDQIVESEDEAVQLWLRSTVYAFIDELIQRIDDSAHPRPDEPEGDDPL
ncbi:hypothetical protein ACIRN4_06160 [Pimelobacter simplex]|uniref:hypothetical protein n=1 Tax=Nocardioides simplex TaxID=2045 RepID=UPI0038114301